METFDIKTQLQIRYDVEVVVVGGGPAGCFAAIAAARNGVKTLLIEKNGILGGTMTAGGINYPGLFFAWGKQIIAGPCWESILRTVQLGGATLPEITVHPKNHWEEQIRLNKAVYTYVLDEFCARDGVEVLFHTMPAYAVETETGVMLAVTGKEGLFAIRAKMLIDATGDADAASMLGYACDVSAVQQPATLTNRLAGYDMDLLSSEKVHGAIAYALQTNALYTELTADKIISYLLNHNLDIHIPCENGADSVSKGAVETEARRKVQRIIQFLKTIPGLENIYIEQICDTCGIRETRRILGEETVTVDDYLRATLYDDAVCYAFYPVDLHVMDGIEQTFLEEGMVPSIPLGAMIPKGARRVVVCGRCISSDALANSAIRVQAPCMAMGQAAGAAAAELCQIGRRIQDCSYQNICKRLEKLGAIIPGSSE